MFTPPRLTPLLLLCTMQLHGQDVNPFDEAARKRELIRERVELEKQRAAARAETAPRLTSDQLHEQAANERAAAQQRAFDRGQRTLLPAQEERESIGRLNVTAAPAGRSGHGPVVRQGAPAAAAYNRVMETQRFFQHYRDPYLRNANDSYTDKPEDRVLFDREALRIYPELRQPQSAFSMRQAEIDRWLDSRLPPLARDARRKLLVAHMVSLELHGQLRRDSYGIGQVPRLHTLGQMPPAFIKRNSFEVEVRGDVVHLPDGLLGTAIRGQDGKPDLIQWLDAQGIHKLLIPQEASGQVRLWMDYECDYHRQELLGGSYRIRFTKP